MCILPFGTEVFVSTASLFCHGTVAGYYAKRDGAAYCVIESSYGNIYFVDTKDVQQSKRTLVHPL